MLKEIMLGAGGAALVVLIIAAFSRIFASKKSDEKVESIYVDELSIGEIKQWFSDNLEKETLKGAILYPTPENIDKWKLEIDASKQSNILIQAVYDEEKDEIVNFRQVIFGTLSTKLQELLDANGGVLVITG